MKHKIVTLTLILLMIGSFGILLLKYKIGGMTKEHEVFCNPETEADVKGLLESSGKINGLVYRNEYLGFEITLPKTWGRSNLYEKNDGYYGPGGNDSISNCGQAKLTFSLDPQGELLSFKIYRYISSRLDSLRPSDYLSPNMVILGKDKGYTFIFEPQYGYDAKEPKMIQAYQDMINKIPSSFRIIK